MHNGRFAIIPRDYFKMLGESDTRKPGEIGKDSSEGYLHIVLSDRSIVKVKGAAWDELLRHIANSHHVGSDEPIDLKKYDASAVWYDTLEFDKEEVSSNIKYRVKVKDQDGVLSWMTLYPVTISDNIIVNQETKETLGSRLSFLENLPVSKELSKNSWTGIPDKPVFKIPKPNVTGDEHIVNSFRIDIASANANNLIQNIELIIKSSAIDMKTAIQVFKKEDIKNNNIKIYEDDSAIYLLANIEDGNIMIRDNSANGGIFTPYDGNITLELINAIDGKDVSAYSLNKTSFGYLSNIDTFTNRGNGWIDRSSVGAPVQPNWSTGIIRNEIENDVIYQFIDLDSGLSLKRVRKDGEEWGRIENIGSGSSTTIVKESQTPHGFNTGDLVALDVDSGNMVLAGGAGLNRGSLGMVFKLDDLSYEVTKTASKDHDFGLVDDNGDQLVEDEYYFLSTKTPGKIQRNNPTIEGVIPFDGVTYQEVLRVQSDSGVMKLLIGLDNPRNIKPPIDPAVTYPTLDYINNAFYNKYFIKSIFATKADLEKASKLPDDVTVGVPSNSKLALDFKNRQLTSFTKTRIEPVGLPNILPSEDSSFVSSDSLLKGEFIDSGIKLDDNGILSYPLDVKTIDHTFIFKKARWLNNGNLTKHIRTSTSDGSINGGEYYSLPLPDDTYLGVYCDIIIKGNFIKGFFEDGRELEGRIVNHGLGNVFTIGSNNMSSTFESLGEIIVVEGVLDTLYVQKYINKNVYIPRVIEKYLVPGANMNINGISDDEELNNSKIGISTKGAKGIKDCLNKNHNAYMHGKTNPPRILSVSTTSFEAGESIQDINGLYWYSKTTFTKAGGYPTGMPDSNFSELNLEEQVKQLESLIPIYVLYDASNGMRLFIDRHNDYLIDIVSGDSSHAVIEMMEAKRVGQKITISCRNVSTTVTIKNNILPLEGSFRPFYLEGYLDLNLGRYGSQTFIFNGREWRVA